MVIECQVMNLPQQHVSVDAHLFEKEGRYIKRLYERSTTLRTGQFKLKINLRRESFHRITHNVSLSERQRHATAIYQTAVQHCIYGTLYIQTHYCFLGAPIRKAEPN